MATNAHWHREKTLACELIFRTCCCCRLAACLGCRYTYPSDYWFEPAELNDVVIPRTKANYDGPDSKLAIGFVENAIIEHCGAVTGYCIGWTEPKGRYNNVLSCTIDSQSGRATMIILPDARNLIYERLETLSDPKGGAIPVEFVDAEAGLLVTEQPSVE
eukprot:m.85901 g.85901  ORF g.85901 m.85901 type:complete len:160 (-) comp14748_c0_seq1:1817-2296(-)